MRTCFAVLALAAAACSSGSSRKDQWYGTDVALEYKPPDGSAIADATPGSDAASPADRPADVSTTTDAITSNADTGTGPTAGPTCTTCEQENIASGECAAGAGCDSLAGTDKDLCLALLSCIRSTGCWKRNVTDCLCGTATGTTCATGGANGPCLAQVQAATKSTSPVTNGTLLNSLTVPSGHATQLVVCDKNHCATECLGGTTDAGAQSDGSAVDAPAGN